MPKGDYKIPFDKDGNQQHCADSWTSGLEWRDNVPFVATLTYAGYSRGRSAANFDFRDHNGKLVVVFLKDFEAMVTHLVNGSVTGSFKFIKRGQNYGCQLIEAGA
ncbi:hypothetical protein [Bradyrhizobium sp. SZCCHNPS1003]|uniref:hypothetical protein n=1 Tax=Bradyrhizobium sp. SZCCHNPS1003 TaxID=3057330 RepID=UPI0028EE267B|nr:hypothetical protein [Bradyrhizobium sp. SZCCHNPS1003]